MGWRHARLAEYGPAVMRLPAEEAAAPFGRASACTEGSAKEVSQPMTFTTEDLGDVPDVDIAALDEVLASDGFGKFAILSVSEEEFLQAGNDWQPDEECRAFQQAHSSDPWVLEFRAGGRQYQASERISLDQVRDAFRSYLAGGSEWRTGFAWAELDL